MTRLSLDQWFMDIAQVAATRSTCVRAQVGCAIARGNQLLVIGYNGVPSGQPHCTEVGCIIGPTGGCMAQHAEHNALVRAVHLGVDVHATTAYTTLMPCLGCAHKLRGFGISRVVYRDAYRRTDGVDFLQGRGVVVSQLALG